MHASVAGACEISVKVALGRLDFDLASLEGALAASGIDLKRTARIATLPHQHCDPFDRMLVARALSESMTLVSRDREFAADGVRLLGRDVVLAKRGPRRTRRSSRRSGATPDPAQ